MKEKKYWESRESLKKLCILIALFMAVVMLASMIYFRQQIQESAALVDSLEYQTYDKYYVIITENRKNLFWQNVYEGAAEEARESNVYVGMLGENLSTDYDKHQLMEIAVNAKVDGIIVEGEETDSLKKSIQQAEDAGIPVVTALYDNPDSLRQSFVGISSYNLGREYGTQVCEIAQARGSKDYNVLVLLDAEKEGNSQNIIISTMREVIQDQKMDEQISLGTVQIPGGSMFAAEESIRDIFMTSEKLPDIIVCLNEQNTTCVYQTVVDYNKVGQVEIVGYYESETIRSAIEKRIIYSTISIQTEQMGRYCVEALNEYTGSGNVSDYYDVDAELVNAETLAVSEEGGSDERNN